MDYQDPPLEWQLDIHQRIVTRDPVAFSELCERSLPLLKTALQIRFPNIQDASLLETVLHDLLLSYDQHPHQYDPERGSLFVYLRMAAGDDVLNALAKQKRNVQRLDNFDDRPVELDDPDGYIEQEYFDLADWVAEHTDLTPAAVITGLIKELDQSEAQALQLILEGVRETERYAPLINVDHLDIEAQRREVKRLKDRVMKKYSVTGNGYVVMSNSDILLHMARRLAIEPDYMAYLIEKSTQVEQITWEALAWRLGLKEASLVKLALCRRPRPNQLVSDIQRIADHVGMDMNRLLTFVREVEALEAFQSNNLETSSWLMAARDKDDDDELPSDKDI